MDPNTVLYLAFAQIVQLRRPLPVLHQVISYSSRKKDVTGVAAIHYPLGHVDSSTCDVRATADVDDFANRPAMNAHPDKNTRTLLQRLR
jgi:hypothetical protein